MRAVKSFILTLGISYLVCLLWMGLEVIFYGEVQPRVVDDIIMLVIMTILFITIHKALGNKEKITEEEE